MYDLFLQHNASKQVFLFKYLRNSSDNSLYYQFDDFEMPAEAPFGEYTYFLISNDAEVTYDFKDVFLDTVIKPLDEKYSAVKLRQLYPETGLMKYLEDDSQEEQNYKDTERSWGVYKRKDK